MLIIKKLKETELDAEFAVSLINNIGSEEESKISYRCDKAHIKHMLREILRNLNIAEILKILSDN